MMVNEQNVNPPPILWNKIAKATIHCELIIKQFKMVDATVLSDWVADTSRIS